MNYPTIDPNSLRDNIRGPCWELGANWLDNAGITKIPGHYIDHNNPESSHIWIDNLWEYIQSLDNVFTEPLGISIDFDNGSLSSPKPLLDLLPHLTGLISLSLNCNPHYDESDDEEVNQPRNILGRFLGSLNPSALTEIKQGVSDLFGNIDDSVGSSIMNALAQHESKEQFISPKTVLSRWIGSFTPFQLNQLQHLSLEFLDCSVENNDISEWLKQMPHLQSLSIAHGDSQWESTLHIPPLAELKQLYIRSHIPAELLDIPVLPSLTRLSVNVRFPETTSPWLPNLAKMTALESLTRFSLTLAEMIEMSRYLPLQLSEVSLFALRLEEEESRDEFWRNMMHLTQLTKLNIPDMDEEVPGIFYDWMATSPLSIIKLQIYSNEESTVHSLARVLPNLKYLQSLDIRGELGLVEKQLKKCTQLTRLLMMTEPKDLPVVVSVVENMRELDVLVICCTNALPTSFYAFHFPQLTTLAIVVAGSDLHLLADFLQRHPKLTDLVITFVGDVQVDIEKSWDILLCCPELVTIQRIDETRYLMKHVLTSLPPTLRKLSWRSLDGIADLDVTGPAGHLLTHFYDEVNTNNVRRHQTLVDLHVDFISSFWPALANKESAESVEHGGYPFSDEEEEEEEEEEDSDNDSQLDDDSEEHEEAGEEDEEADARW